MGSLTGKMTLTEIMGTLEALEQQGVTRRDLKRLRSNDGLQKATVRALRQSAAEHAVINTDMLEGLTLRQVLSRAGVSDIPTSIWGGNLVPDEARYDWGWARQLFLIDPYREVDSDEALEEIPRFQLQPACFLRLATYACFASPRDFRVIALQDSFYGSRGMDGERTHVPALVDNRGVRHIELISADHRFLKSDRFLAYQQWN